MKQQCKTEGCGNDSHAKGYCGSCYRKYVARAEGRPRCTHESGCNKPAEARDLCSTHYAQWRRTTHRDREPCIIDACGGPYYSRGLCTRHYSQARLYNLEPNDLRSMLAGGCSISGCAVKTDLTIDHDHDCCDATPTCGKCTRGAICNPHNLAIGHLHNSHEEAFAVAQYLQKFTD